MPTYGFELKQERQMPEIGGVARLWKHEKTGAEVLSIQNDDENKCFGASFYTPPEDSTGVAHILEHSVLCGSDKYPVKEPFVELLKGSLQTFLNAFTFPDKTCYPVASANLKDFYNLVDVYLDAVFHPLISEDIFRQEGWHIESEDQASPWSYKGVVFNEMKGAYSQADSMLAEKSQQSLFPDNIYSLDSGGDPAIITRLSYEQFRKFHATHYNPSNARFFFWGDDPEEERLRIISEAIRGSERVPVQEPVALQKKFKEPRALTASYPAAPDEKRALFTINWLLPERGNVEEALKMEMLEHILEGLPGSPLRRALMESGLAEDTTGCGLETDLRQMYYSTGLKGILPENVQKAEALVLQVLQDLPENGIGPEVVESALNSIEFAYRENNSGRFPRGLAAMIRALSTWLYDEDPLSPLAWEKPLQEIRKRVENGEKIFEEAIKKYFLDNPHRVTVTLLPDENLAQTLEQQEKQKLDRLYEKADQNEKEQVVRITRELKTAQLKPDDPEDLAKIPSLEISDLQHTETAVPSREKKNDHTVLLHDLSTNGILYANLLFPVKKISENLIPYLPLFSRSLLEWGTRKHDYASLGMLVGARTGGIGAAPLPVLKSATRETSLYFAVQGKTVASRLNDFFEIISEILLEPQENRGIILQRLTQMILEEKARLEYALAAGGHATVISRLKARYRPEHALLEKFGGIAQLRFIKNLEKRLQSEPEKVLDEFNLLRSQIFTARDVILDLAGDGKLLDEGTRAGENLIGRLPENTDKGNAMDVSQFSAMRQLPEAEAFITQGQINFVGKGANLHDLGIKYGGASQVISRWLRMGPLWENVRVAGGAYGAFCSLDKNGGTWTYASYRDPNLLETLKVYDGMGEILRNLAPSDAQLKQAIIGAVGDLDTYLLPDAKAAKALGWHLSGETAEERQKRREEMLSCTKQDFKDFAEILDSVAANGAVTVVGGLKTAQVAEEKGWTSENLI